MTAVPRYHTPPTPGAATFGPSIAATGKLLGRPFMPWQLEAARIIGELSDDGQAMRYPYVVIHVPRRAGKGVLDLSTSFHRLFTGTARRCHYTAQTRAAAGGVFREEWVPMIQSTALYPREVRVRQSNGSESLTLLRARSTLKLFAPTADAIHGEDSDLATVDEAWSFSLEQGGTIEAGIQPAQLTRPRRQLLIVSAGGTVESTWLDRWMTLARAGTPGVALIDYGADPDVDDLDDPAVWARIHPAVGHTITVDGIATLRGTMERPEFDRAVLGVWTSGATAPSKIVRAEWARMLEPAAAPEGRITYGLAVAHDGAAAAIVAAGRFRDGVAVEVVEHGPGVGWVVDTWRAIRRRSPGRLYVDQLGPAASVVDALVRARLPVELVTTSTYVTACDGMIRDLPAHRGQPVLDASAHTATARAVGDRWVWERKRGDTSPIEAATLAVYGHRRPRSTVAATVAPG